MEFGSAPEKGEGLPFEEPSLLEELVIHCANVLQPDIAHGWRRDFHSGDIAFDMEKADFIALQAKSDSIAQAHGGANVEGI